MNNIAHIIYSSVIQLIIFILFFFFFCAGNRTQGLMLVGQDSAETVVTDFLHTGKGRTCYTGCLD